MTEYQEQPKTTQPTLQDILRRADRKGDDDKAVVDRACRYLQDHPEFTEAFWEAVSKGVYAEWQSTNHERQLLRLQAVQRLVTAHDPKHPNPCKNAKNRGTAITEAILASRGGLAERVRLRASMLDEPVNGKTVGDCTPEELALYLERVDPQAPTP